MTYTFITYNLIGFSRSIFFFSFFVLETVVSFLILFQNPEKPQCKQLFTLWLQFFFFFGICENHISTPSCNYAPIRSQVEQFMRKTIRASITFLHSACVSMIMFSIKYHSSEPLFTTFSSQVSHWHLIGAKRRKETCLYQYNVDSWNVSLFEWAVSNLQQIKDCTEDGGEQSDKNSIVCILT